MSTISNPTRGKPPQPALPSQPRKGSASHADFPGMPQQQTSASQSTANGAPLSFVTPHVTPLLEMNSGPPPGVQTQAMMPGTFRGVSNPTMNAQGSQLISHGRNGANAAQYTLVPAGNQPSRYNTAPAQFQNLPQYAAPQAPQAFANAAQFPGGVPQPFFWQFLPPTANQYYPQTAGYMSNPQMTFQPPTMPPTAMSMHHAQQQYAQPYPMAQQQLQPPPSQASDYQNQQMPVQMQHPTPPVAPLPSTAPAKKTHNKILRIVDPTTNEVTNLREITEAQAQAAADAAVDTEVAVASTSGRLSAPPPVESRSESRQSSVAVDFCRQVCQQTFDPTPAMAVEQRISPSPPPPVQNSASGIVNGGESVLERMSKPEKANENREWNDEAQTDLTVEFGSERATPMPEEAMDDFSIRSGSLQEDEVDETVEEEQEGGATEMRRRQIALLAEHLVQAEQQQQQDGEGVYSRDFLWLCCDIVKTIEKPACPLGEAQLKEWQLDRSAQPSQSSDRQRRYDQGGGGKTTFNTPWMQGGVMSVPRIARPPYTGRQSDRPGGRQGGRRVHGPPMPRPSIERPSRPAEPLHRVENPWKPDRDGGQAEDVEVAAKKLYKEVRGLLNKITPSTFEDLCQEFLRLQVYKMQDRMPSIIDIIFDKAVEEPKFCPLYSDLCRRQVEDEMKEGDKGSKFRNIILTRCQMTFEDKQQGEIAQKKEAAEAETDEKSRANMMSEIEDLQRKERRRMFGNIGFIGQLYRNGLIVPKILHWCIIHLLKGHKEAKEKGEKGDEESIECAVRILETVGQFWDKERVFPVPVPVVPQTGGGHRGRGGGAGHTPQPVVQSQQQPTDEINMYYKHLEEISDQVSNRVRFLIVNLIEMRNSNWKPRETAESGPKTIQEVHKEVAKEQLENKVARDQYDQRSRGTGGRPGDYSGGSGGSRSVRGTGTGGGSMRPATLTGRASADNRSGGGQRTVQQQSEKRQQAAAAANTIQSTTSRKNAVTGDTLGTQKRAVWSTGARGGGQQTAASGDSRRFAATTPASISQEGSEPSSREPSESRKHSIDSDRLSALKAAAEMTADPKRAALFASSPTTATQPVAEDEEEEDEERACENGSQSPSATPTPPPFTSPAVSDGSIVNGLKTEVLEYSTDVVKIGDVYNTIRERVAKDGGDATRVFRLLMQLGVEHFAGPSGEQRRKHIGQIFCRCLQDESLREGALKGVEDFCVKVVEDEMWLDLQRVWEELAEILVWSILCDQDHCPGWRPSMNHFYEAFLAASTDRRKPHVLLFYVLKQFVVHHEEAEMVRMFAEMTRMELNEQPELREILQKTSIGSCDDESRSLLDVLIR